MTQLAPVSMLLDAVELPTVGQGFYHMPVPGLLTPAQYAAIERLKKSQRVLIRNDGATTGERWPCKHCRSGGPAAATHVVIKPTFHPFFTVACVPAPFSGLQAGLTKYVQVSSNPEIRRKLLPFLPELADTNPQMARQMRPKEPGDDLWLFVVGLAEPIDADADRDLREKIAYRTRTPFRP